MSRRQNKKREESLRKEVEEVERKVDRAIELDKKTLSELELKGLKLVQNSNGGTAMPTDNSVVAGGAPANVSAVPSGGVFPAGASVDFTQDDPNAGEVTLASGAPDANGNPTVDITVIAGALATGFNLNASVKRTDSTVISAPPLAMKITTLPPPPPTELTGLSLVQNS